MTFNEMIKLCNKCSSMLLCFTGLRKALTFCGHCHKLETYPNDPLKSWSDPISNCLIIENNVERHVIDWITLNTVSEQYMDYLIATIPTGNCNLYIGSCINCWLKNQYYNSQNQALRSSLLRKNSKQLFDRLRKRKNV